MITNLTILMNKATVCCLLQEKVYCSCKETKGKLQSICFGFTQVAFDDEVFCVMIKIKSEDVESLTQVPNKDKLETKLIPLSLLQVNRIFNKEVISKRK